MFTRRKTRFVFQSGRRKIRPAPILLTATSIWNPPVWQQVRWTFDHDTTLLATPTQFEAFCVSGNGDVLAWESPTSAVQTASNVITCTYAHNVVPSDAVGMNTARILSKPTGKILQASRFTVPQSSSIAGQFMNVLGVVQVDSATVEFFMDSTVTVFPGGPVNAIEVETLLGFEAGNVANPAIGGSFQILVSEMPIPTTNWRIIDDPDSHFILEGMYFVWPVNGSTI